jgi:hypothetical protein
MEKIDLPVQTGKVPCGLQVDLEPMDIYPDRYAVSKTGLMCGNRLVQRLGEEFVACGPGFIKACPAFGDLVRPICPFDPIDVVDKLKTAVRMDELQARVKELEVKMAKK